MMNRHGYRVVVAALWSGLLAVPASAALVENLTMGNAKALSLGNAVTADPPGIDSVHYNPAGLANLDGRQYNLKVLAANMQFGVDFGGHDAKTQQMIDYFGYHDESAYQSSDTSTVGLRLPYNEGIYEWPLPFLVAPLGGASYRPLNSNMTFATAAYTPMAAGYIRDDDDPARYMGQYMSMMRIVYFSPSIGIQVNDELQVGATIHFSWQGVTAGTQIRVPNMALALGENLTEMLQVQDLCPDPGDPEPVINFCGLEEEVARLGPYTDVAKLEFDAESSLVTGINVGFIWQPLQWLKWGAVYQTESDPEIHGTYRLTYNDEWVNFFGGLHESDLGGAIQSLIPFPVGNRSEKGNSIVRLVTPAHFSTGVSLQMTPRWKFNMDAKWTDWAAWDGLTVKFDKALDFTRLATLVSDYSRLTELTIPRHYKSVWNWAFGWEYQYSSDLALRFGYEPRKTSIPDDKQDVLLPVGDADLYSVGFAYKLPEGQVVEMALGYVAANADVPANSSTNANSSDDLNNFIYNPYAGTDFSTYLRAYLVEFSYSAYF